jgi:hypothetical protein
MDGLASRDSQAIRFDLDGDDPDRRDLDRRTVEQAYARWAPIYDAVCLA